MVYDKISSRYVLKIPPIPPTPSLWLLLIFKPIPKFTSVSTLLSSQSQRREGAAWEGCQPGSCI